MNEKYKQYYNIQNDKNLIEKKIPNERDLERFNDWRNSKREQLKKSWIAMSIGSLILVIIGIALKNLFGIIFILIGVYLEYYTLKEFLNSKNWKLEYCDYGNIIDKYIKEDKNDNDKDYYVIVDVNKNNLKYKLKRKEFSELDISDNVIVIAIQNKKETFIVKNN